MLGEIALALTSAFAGAALYINVAEQPARLFLDDAGALTQWKPSYARAALMQGGLAAAAGALDLALAWQTKDYRWLAAASLILANLPYTFIGIFPTNARLKETAVETANAATRALLVRWGRLHAARTVLGLLSAAAAIWAMG